MTDKTDTTTCDHIMVEEREAEGCIKCGAFAWAGPPQLPSDVMVTIMLGRYKSGKGFETVQAQGNGPHDVTGALKNAIERWEKEYG